LPRNSPAFADDASYNLSVGSLRDPGARLYFLVVARKIEDAYILETLQSKFRKALIDRLPVEPILDLMLPPIEVMIPVGPSDIHKLPLTLAGIEKNVGNPISELTIVTPNEFSLREKLPSFDFTIMEDSEVLGKETLNQVNDISSRWSARIPRGWFIQQLIKLAFVQNSNAAGVLIVDSETVLLRKRNFLNSNGVQLLIPSYEFHKPYETHYALFFKNMRKFPTRSKLSYVAHHQLFQPSIIREMFVDKEALTAWLRSGDTNSRSSPVSEYHCYGRYITENYPEKVALGSFRNIASSYRNSEFSRFDSKKLNSVSFHEYAT